MYDGQVNKKSGVLVINLPTTGFTDFTAAHGDEEKSTLYPHVSGWISINIRTDYDKRYPFMPSRIIGNLLKNGAKVSVANWNTVMADTEKLKLLIDLTYQDRASCDYDLSTPMRRANS